MSICSLCWLFSARMRSSGTVVTWRLPSFDELLLGNNLIYTALLDKLKLFRLSSSLSVFIDLYMSDCRRLYAAVLWMAMSTIVFKSSGWSISREDRLVFGRIFSNFSASGTWSHYFNKFSFRFIRLDCWGFWSAIFLFNFSCRTFFSFSFVLS